MIFSLVDMMVRECCRWDLVSDKQMMQEEQHLQVSSVCTLWFENYLAVACGVVKSWAEAAGGKMYENN